MGEGVGSPLPPWIRQWINIMMITLIQIIQYKIFQQICINMMENDTLALHLCNLKQFAWNSTLLTLKHSTVREFAPITLGHSHHQSCRIVSFLPKAPSQAYLSLKMPVYPWNPGSVYMDLLTLTGYQFFTNRSEGFIALPMVINPQTNCGNRGISYELYVTTLFSLNLIIHLS